MASAAAARSLTGSWSQTLRLAMGRMLCPPGDAHSLDGRQQLFNGYHGQNGGCGTWCRGKVGTGNRNVNELAREEFDLAVPDVSRKVGKPRQLQNSAEQRMAGIVDGDLAFAGLFTQRGITLAEVCRCRTGRPGRRSRPT